MHRVGCFSERIERVGGTHNGFFHESIFQILNLLARRVLKYALEQELLARL